MDRKTTTGIVLILFIFLGYTYFIQPSKQQIEQAKHRRDSIEQVKKDTEIAQSKQVEVMTVDKIEAPSISSDSSSISTHYKNLYGDFGVSAQGTEEFYTLENNLVKITLTNKGGRIQSVELKNFKRFDSKKLILFEGDKSVQNLAFFSQNRSIQTDQLFFVPTSDKKNIVVSGPIVPKGKEGRIEFNQKNKGEKAEFILRLNADNGRYIDYVYSLDYNSYMVNYSIRTSKVEQLISTNTGFLSFNFAFDVPRQERASTYGEDGYSSIYYRFKDDDVDYLSLSKSDSKELTTPVKWIGFKQLFFSSILIADDAFPNAKIENDKKDSKSALIGRYKADIGIPFDSRSDIDFKMKFYFGPNHYATLKSFDLGLEKQINLGWPVVREVNRYLIIPVFNFLREYMSNFGLIILVLTVLIRILVFPFTYKSYISQAKMKALKPEIDELSKKYPADKAMEKQQATMALYKKAGVNPLGGCLPLLFQMPFLIAMFYFFPGSIELRQESFLWATDLSTYDSIFKLPFFIPMYGDHVSLFTLLMTITQIIQTKISGQTAGSDAMPGMKYMMYLMPIFFMLILNSYSSGLSYYYFLANVFTIGQTYIVRMFIDEDKVRAQIMIAKKQPEKKSKFQQRLEEMAKQQNARKR